MSRILGIVGNCSYNALLSRGSVEWLCWPRPDSPFVFGPLLDRERGGAFTVEGGADDDVVQEYVENTNVLRTVFSGRAGSFELIDFAPRFQLYDRSFKPSMLVRILRPLAGDPRVRVRCRPTWDYGRVAAGSWRASNHIEYTGLPAPVRLTTNVPLSYVEEERPFLLERDHHLVLTWGQPLEAGLEETAERFLERTLDYWRQWVKRTRVPRDYQREVIRAALVLKLHQYEDTGALLAATTTSLPEHPGSGRTWDYRYCWLRDAYFTLNALERLGHSDEMERFLVFLRNVAEASDGRLQPVYTITGGDGAPEQELPHLSGCDGDGPVRIGNQAFEHVQNDVYGEMILAIARLLLDARFAGSVATPQAIRLVERLLRQIDERLLDPDSGPWELRGERKLHAFTLLAHWAGARQAAEIGEALGAAPLREQALAVAARAAEALEQRCWSPELGAFVQAAGERQLDASLLLALHLELLSPDDPRAASHVDAIRRELAVEGGILRRYAVPDDFGVMRAAFTVCSFWLVEALAILGRRDEARELFEHLLSLHNGLGLYSEDVLPETRTQTGNFPQTYSHVGLINAAFRLSRSWD
ncbi:MAG TPA: glycoside hydrolase family 15 protein [Gaiellaceae bacterium]|nr:glycoside hydrolase family 15 protein [Gaiellaceae bacterium]